MRSGWRKVNLGQILSFSNGKSSPERSPNFPYPVYGSNGIIGFSSETNSDRNTIIIGRVGSYCGSLQYSEIVCWVTDNAIRASAIDGHNSRFLFYLLQTLGLNDWRAGSGQPLLNQTILSSIPTAVPHISEQHRIAQILGALDDKIELNRRMNATLEGMARALFKSWFVEFEPVRAKMEGHWHRGEALPGMSAELYDLFPERLVPSELGDAPDGWGVKPLGELIELAYGKALKAADRRGGKTPVYGSNGRVGWHDEALADGPGVIVGRKGTPGIVTWSHTPFYPIDTTFYVKSKNEGLSLFFLHYALREQNLPSVAADSAVPGLNRNLAYMNKQLVPPAGIIAAFNTQAIKLFSQMYRSEEESKILANLRDTLLPELVSGKMRVNDVENPNVGEGCRC